ncbi:MAG: DUF3343 domain-containing protein [Thermoplasmata archaeon]|nr:DUF3343 domain-containing protein [Thermoplasmata archaeon]
MAKLEKKYSVVLFYSTSLAMRAENVAKSAHVSVKLIPTPRHLSSDCGIALRFHVKDEEKITKALRTAKVDYDQISLL